MPLLNISPLPVDGMVAAANLSMSYFYDPVGDSFEILNGHLDRVNKSSSWRVGRPQVRPGSMSGGRMVALTGNLDYLAEIFPDDNDEPGAYIPIPGAGISFRLPFAAKVVVFTWQIVGANDQEFGTPKDEPTELRMFIDDSRQDGQFRVIPESTDNDTTPGIGIRHKDRERVWSGHWIRAAVSGTSALAAGWHSAYIGIYNKAPNARIRIRNMKYLFWGLLFACYTGAWHAETSPSTSQDIATVTS